MKEVTMYQTDFDEQVFPTAEEARAHESMRADEVEIAEFCVAGELTKGQATRAKNIIVRFLKWRANGELPPKPEE